jgi:hypothetical protein
MVAGQEAQRAEAQSAQQRATKLREQLATVRERGHRALAEGD